MLYAPTPLRLYASTPLRPFAPSPLRPCAPTQIMDPVLLHLRINHAPIILGVVGALFLIAGMVAKRITLLRYGQISLLLAGLSAPVAFLTGREAEEHTEKTWYIEKKVVHAHEEAGEQASIALVITGILAAVSLLKDRKVVRVLLLIGAIASAALVTRAAFEGGEIVHENQKLEAGPGGAAQPLNTLPQSAQ